MGDASITQNGQCDSQMECDDGTPEGPINPDVSVNLTNDVRTTTHDVLLNSIDNDHKAPPFDQSNETNVSPQSQSCIVTNDLKTSSEANVSDTNLVIEDNIKSRLHSDPKENATVANGSTNCLDNTQKVESSSDANDMDVVVIDLPVLLSDNKYLQQDSSSDSDSSSSSSDESDSVSKQNDVTPVDLPQSVTEGKYRQQVIEILTSDSESSSESSDSSFCSSSEDENDDNVRKEEKEGCNSQPAPQPEDNKKVVDGNRKTRKNYSPYFKEDSEKELLPAIKDLQISVKEEEALVIGEVSLILNCQVIVQAHVGIPPINLKSILFLDKGKRALGEIFEVFGLVQDPLYIIRFNSSDDITKKGIKVGQPIYYAPCTEHTTFIVIHELMRVKGSDSSWKDDIETPDKYLDFSDDEEERFAKQAKRKERMELKMFKQNYEFELSRLCANPFTKPDCTIINEAKKRKFNTYSTRPSSAARPFVGNRHPLPNARFGGPPQFKQPLNMSYNHFQSRPPIAYLSRPPICSPSPPPPFMHHIPVRDLTTPPPPINPPQHPHLFTTTVVNPIQNHSFSTPPPSIQQPHINFTPQISTPPPPLHQPTTSRDISVIQPSHSVNFPVPPPPFIQPTPLPNITIPPPPTHNAPIQHRPLYITPPPPPHHNPMFDPSSMPPPPCHLPTPTFESGNNYPK